jgi:peptidoglycan/LPS O-acetylase OafA/YrhL
MAAALVSGRMSESTTHAGAPPGPTWYTGIEALRGIAALAVVIHHCWSVGTQPRFTGYWVVEGFGLWGVSLFFVLSGYLLPDAFWGTKAAGRLRRFYLRRIFRIVPAYYATVAILFIFFAQHEVLFSRTGVEQIVSNVTFTHYLRPETSSSLNVNGALWTLTIEALLYGLMPLLAWTIRVTAGWGALILVAIGVSYKLYIARLGEDIQDLYFEDAFPTEVARLFLSRQFLGILPLFAIGIGLKWLRFNGRLDRLRMPLATLSTWLRITLLLVPSVLWLVFVERSSQYTHWVWFSGFETVLGLMLVPAILASGEATKDLGVLDRGAVWLGQRSYGLYLWHFPIILSVYGRGPFLREPNMSTWGLRLALIAGLSVVAAHVSWVAIERPMQDLGRRAARAWTGSRASGSQKRP